MRSRAPAPTALSHCTVWLCSRAALAESAWGRRRWARCARWLQCGGGRQLTAGCLRARARWGAGRVGESRWREGRQRGSLWRVCSAPQHVSSELRACSALPFARVCTHWCRVRTAGVGAGLDPQAGEAGCVPRCERIHCVARATTGHARRAARHPAACVGLRSACERGEANGRTLAAAAAAQTCTRRLASLPHRPGWWQLLLGAHPCA